MFVATNRLTIKKGYGPDLEERFARQGRVAEASGFLGFELWKLLADGETEEYVVVTHWESNEAHEAWAQSDAFRQAHSGGSADFMAGHPEFGTYDVRLEVKPANV